MKFDWSVDNGDNCGFGFFRANSNPAGIAALIAVTAESAVIVVHDQTPTFYTNDGAVNETTDVSAHISDNTWFDGEIIISASDVKLYIDETLRATHSVRVPSAVWQLVLGATCVNDTNQYTFAEYAQVWGE